VALEQLVAVEFVVLLLRLVFLRLSSTCWRVGKANDLLVFEAQVASFRCVLAFAHASFWYVFLEAEIMLACGGTPLKGRIEGDVV
jgi:hypothetical protein